MIKWLFANASVLREPTGWGWRQLSHALPQNAGVVGACQRIGPTQSGNLRMPARQPPSRARLRCCLFPKITGPCTGRPRKPNSFPATRQKGSLFHHRKGENILTNACFLDGWQSCHGKEAAAPFGDGRWGAGSGNFWALLAAQVWRRATNPPLLTAEQSLNTSRLTPNARWLLHGSYETNSVFGDLSPLERLHNP